MIEMKISGFAELDKMLSKFPIIVETKCIRTSTRAGAKVILDAAKGNAPVRQTSHPVKVSAGTRMWRLPGYLYKSLRIAFMRRPTYLKGCKVVYMVYAPSKLAFYARFLEFGTSKMSKRPFLRPAFDRSIGQSIEAQRVSLKKMITKEWGKNHWLSWKERG